ncbi:macrosialin-like [Betta splendens]|uniref:Macrosialin-like n=1 Tax=Betta splendens TaxID=158456 RepID=A0A6P7LTP0_BETSP|nr:macrosialin-like [Betta splendens]
MKTAALFLVLSCCALSALSLDGNVKRSKPSATVVPAQQFNSSPSTTKPATNTTTPAANTTTPAANTTTPAANTTTHAPNTTTHAPNTTTHAPNTTTHAPNTTTHAPTTTTHAPNTTTPAPTPSSTVGNYSLKMGNKTCLMANMALQIRLKAGATFKVQPDKTKTEGGCKATTANLTIAFKEGYITFMFNQSAADKTVYVNQVSFNISHNFMSLNANGQYSGNNASLHLFSAKVGRSYSCRNDSIFMGNDLYLDVSQDRIQAFNLTADKDFGPPDVCEADKPDYSVAIGVGVALLVLIVIVVVVYVVSRRRRTDGYQSL